MLSDHKEAAEISQAKPNWPIDVANGNRIASHMKPTVIPYSLVILDLVMNIRQFLQLDSIEIGGRHSATLRQHSTSP